MTLYCPVFNACHWEVWKIDTENRFRKLTPRIVEWCGMLLNAETLFSNESAAWSWVNKDYGNAYKSIVRV